MDDYLCLTLLANPGESEAAFKLRLTHFWTHMLRQYPDAYEKVYAEATHFGRVEGRVSRQYLVEAIVLDALVRELNTGNIASEPVDREDTYSKYEATPPDWFWIEH